MALVKCPECGKEISSFAKSCPNCGYPLSLILQTDNSSSEKRKKSTYLHIINSNGVPVTDDIKEGTLVEFGNYPHAKDGTIEPIRWKVMKMDNGRAYLLSVNVLDAHCFDSSSTFKNWANSELRKWLNSTFLNKAFTPDEQARIISSNLFTSQRDENESKTIDKVFLYSSDDKLNVSDADIRKAVPTEYAINSGVVPYESDDDYYTLDGEHCCTWWWREQYYASRWTGYGSEILTSTFYGSKPNIENIGVRPAIWVYLDTYEKDVLGENYAEVTYASLNPQYQSLINIQNSDNEISVGSIITFGRYPQTSSGGIKPIEWIVLSVEKGNVLLLSLYALEMLTYRKYNNLYAFGNERSTYIPNENERIPNILYRIYTNAFTNAERQLIKNTNTSSGYLEKIFILSESEVKHYLPGQFCRKTLATEYLKVRGKDNFESDNTDYMINGITCRSWILNAYDFLRVSTPYINLNGSVETIKDNTVLGNYYIRPAITLSLSFDHICRKEQMSMWESISRAFPGSTKSGLLGTGDGSDHRYDDGSSPLDYTAFSYDDI